MLKAQGWKVNAEGSKLKGQGSRPKGSRFKAEIAER